MFDLNSDQVPMLDDSQADTPELTHAELCWLYAAIIRKVVGGEDVDREMLAEVMDALGISAEQLEADVAIVRSDVDDSHREGNASQFDDGETQLKRLFEQARKSLA